MFSILYCLFPVEDLQNLVGLLTSSAEILTKDHPLWTEIKVFQNIQAKYKRILHCDKCLQLLQRVSLHKFKILTYISTDTMFICVIYLTCFF